MRGACRLIGRHWRGRWRCCKRGAGGAAWGICMADEPGAKKPAVKGPVIEFDPTPSRQRENLEFDYLADLARQRFQDLWDYRNITPRADVYESMRAIKPVRREDIELPSVSPMPSHAPTIDIEP